ncbi:MAG: SDR family oxidoreductase [Pseudomonadota bacterium]
MNLDLSGRTALVGGASRGIGRASAKVLAGMGARVIATGRTGELLESLLDELAGPVPHAALVVDYDDPDAVVAAVQAHLADGPINILVNNTGGPPGGEIIDAQGEAFEAGFRRHVLVGQRLVQLLTSGMIEARYGRIINIVSTSVREPIPGLGVSNTIRAAVAGWAKTLATELGPHEITINNVLPGFTDTERLEQIIAARAAKAGVEEADVAAAMRGSIPFGRFADATEVANLLGFLASPAASYVSGQSIAADGGRMVSI